MKEIKSAKTKDEREKINRNNTKKQTKKYTHTKNKPLITPHSLDDDMTLVNEYRAGFRDCENKIKTTQLYLKSSYMKYFINLLISLYFQSKTLWRRIISVLPIVFFNLPTADLVYLLSSLKLCTAYHILHFYNGALIS